MNYRQRADSHWPTTFVFMVAAGGLLLYSQTLAFYEDEGFHLLAAKLVNAGKIPYRDFFYQHPPVFPYLYAGWMQVAGETWRSAHFFSALLTAAMIWMVVDFVRSGEPGSPAGLGILAVVLLAFNMSVVFLGTVGHPYALCMCMSMLSFRLLVAGIRTANPRGVFLAGFSAGGALLSSMLVAPLIPVMAIWIWMQVRTPFRFRQLGYFVGGAAIWAFPMVWMYVQAPGPFLFDLFEYHLYYRGPSFRVQPIGSLLQGLEELWRWLRYPEGIGRTALALIGIWSLFRRGTEDSPRRAELRLTAGIAIALALFLIAPYPSFRVYFVVLSPFLVILACHGAAVLGAGMQRFLHPRYLFAILAAISVAVFTRYMLLAPDIERSPWSDIEMVAAAVNRVAPEPAPVHVPEYVYFASGRLPPQGLENSYGSELVLPESLAAELRIIPEAQITDWIKGGRFAAVWLYEFDPRRHSLAMGSIYRRWARMSAGADGYLFWEGMP